MAAQEILQAANPFDAGDTVYGCPSCKSVGSLVRACSVPGCTQLASNGTPDFRGFRYFWACHDHGPHGK